MKTKLSPLFIATFLICLSTWAFAQKKSTVELTGYVDAYYARYNTDLNSNNFQSFSTVSPRNNHFGVNIASISMNYDSKNVRSAVTLHAGDIQQATWSSKFPYIQEANVGFHLVKDLWLSAGFFTTHVGTESFLPKNNMLSTTSIITYNEPFYQGGAKLSYEKWDNISLELWLLNGYNQFVDINSCKAYGVLFGYEFNPNASITYTGLYGNENQLNDPFWLTRYYNNIYFDYNWKNKIKAQVGVDYAIQDGYMKGDAEETSALLSSEGSMLAYLATIRFILTKNWSATVRYESQNDTDGIIAGRYEINDDVEFNTQGINIQGVTIGTEYKVQDSGYLRAEWRQLTDQNNVILWDNRSGSRREFTITMGYEFGKKW